MAAKKKRPPARKAPAKPAAAPRKAKPKRESAKARTARIRREKLGAAKAAHAAAVDTGKKQVSEAFAAHQFKPGQSGNPKGRPKGARSKLAEDFVRDLAEAWEARGRAAIDLAIEESPIGFVRIVAGVIPQEVDHRFRDLEDLSDEELDARLARGAAIIGAVAGGAPDAGAPARGKAAPV